MKRAAQDDRDDLRSAAVVSEPRIQYAKTADGTSIAFWAVGDGHPLVIAPTTPFSHAQLEWNMPECRRWFERLAGSHMLIRYDGRGTGLSTREIADYSLEANVSDLDAVVNRLELERLALFASADSSMPAIVYAARNPERVSHLLLWNAWANRAEISETPQSRAMRALLEQDWEIYTEAVARVLLKDEAAAKWLTRFYRECTTPEALRVIVPAVNRWDATPYLSQVSCPVLVMHRRGFRGLNVSVAQALAEAFPTAEFALLEGDSPVPFLGDVDAVLRTMRAFLGDVDLPIVADDGGAPVTILFTDMEGSTPLTQRLGDEKAQEVLRGHNAAIREALRAHNGREIKHTGDGIMASFQSARRALECAIAIQRALADNDGGVRIRIGLNAGEPVAEDRDLFGTAVQLASRVCSEAEPGTILVSNVVRELAAGKGFLFSDRGDFVPRGFEDPVRLFEVRWQE